MPFPFSSPPVDRSFIILYELIKNLLQRQYITRTYVCQALFEHLFLFVVRRVASSATKKFRFEKVIPVTTFSKRNSSSPLIILSLYLEICLWVYTYRTYLRSFLSNADMSAVCTLPDHISILGKNSLICNII